MIDSKNFEDIARRIAATLPTGVRQIQDDVEKNIQAVLQAAFARLDLVTREEFEVQAAVLERTQQRLRQLEAAMADLEKPSVAAPKTRKTRSKPSTKTDEA